MKHANYHATPHRERGAVLAIGLLILVVMTLIGVTGMSTSALQLKMAGNLKDWNVAFQAVEAGLRDGETDIATTDRVSGATGADCGTTGVNASRDGLCKALVGATQNVWQGMDWSSTASTKKYVVYGAKTSATALSGVAAQPRYIIEPVKGNKPGKSLLVNDNQNKIKTYRVTAVGNGGTIEANIMAQSTQVMP